MASNAKKRTLPFEEVYAERLPLGQPRYAQSFMHRDTLTHTVVVGDALVTASTDGVVKFWRWHRDEVGGAGAAPFATAGRAAVVDFVKAFHAHEGPIVALVARGRFLASISLDQTVKVFDLETADLLVMGPIDFVPSCAVWIGEPTMPRLVVGAAEEPSELLPSSSTLFLFDALHGGAGGEPPSTACRSFLSPLPCAAAALCYHKEANVLVIAHRSGDIVFWSIDREEVVAASGPLNHLDDLVKAGATPHSMTLSPSDGGRFLLVTASDCHIRIFRMATGKLYRKYDESVASYKDMYASGRLPASLLAAPRAGEAASEGAVPAAATITPERFLAMMKREEALLATPYARCASCIYDESGNFILFPTMFGVKVVNVVTNRSMSRPLIGCDEEGLRFLSLGLFQGSALDAGGYGRASAATMTLEMAASSNPAALARGSAAPSGEGAAHQGRPPAVEAFIACSAFQRSRLYLFTSDPVPDSRRRERDVVNERPSAAEVEAIAMAAAKKEAAARRAAAAASSRLPQAAIIRTSMGDVHITLFPREAPLAVENFVTLSQRRYYDNLLVHRVIKNFMVQMGDPAGDGTGGASMWGHDFKDEFHPALRHDQAYTVSMANAGKNSNGSQFFITTVKCPWLDDKHTIFGRVTRGKDVVAAIGLVATDDDDKPKEDVRILQIEVAAPLSGGAEGDSDDSEEISGSSSAEDE